MSRSYREVKRVGKKKSRKTPVIVVVIIVIAAILAGMFFVKGQDEGTVTPEGISDNSVQKKGMGYSISASNKEAVLAAEEILKAGGNAVDAAVAMSYALAVVEPHASGLGGGGCMVVYDPETADYYYYNYGSQSSSSGYTGKILVPGFVSGMDTVLTDLGTMELSQLIQPALALCDGYKVDSELAVYINRNTEALGEDSAFFSNGDWLVEGDILIQEELKRTIELIAEEGAEVFYEGKIAEDICKEVGLSMSDFSDYETYVTDPVVGTYNGYEIVSASMPYSGTTLVQMLKMAEMLDIKKPSVDNQAFIDMLQKITIMSHAERVNTVYDYDAVGKTPDTASMVSDAHIKELISEEMPDYELELESEDTTAFTIIDENGMIVSCTNTLSSFFGSKVEVDGIYLNNTARNFGTGVNAYEAGKRPRSHIAPTILRSEDEVIAIATPGGDAILKVLSTVLMDICQFDTEPQEAVDKQRLVFTGNTTISYEIGYETPAIADAYDTGYTAIPNSSHSYFGNVALSGYNKENGFYAVTDARRDGYSVFSNE